MAAILNILMIKSHAENIEKNFTRIFSVSADLSITGIPLFIVFQKFNSEWQNSAFFFF